MEPDTLFGHCSKCGEPLEDVFDIYPHRRRTDFPQKKDATVLEIRFGYGMFMDEPATAVILCKACSETFFKENPFLLTWIKLYGGNVYYQ